MVWCDVIGRLAHRGARGQPPNDVTQQSAQSVNKSPGVATSYIRPWAAFCILRAARLLRRAATFFLQRAASCLRRAACCSQRAAGYFLRASCCIWRVALCLRSAAFNLMMATSCSRRAAFYILRAIRRLQRTATLRGRHHTFEGRRVVRRGRQSTF